MKNFLNKITKKGLGRTNFGTKFVRFTIIKPKSKCSEFRKIKLGRKNFGSKFFRFTDRKSCNICSVLSFIINEFSKIFNINCCNNFDNNSKILTQSSDSAGRGGNFDESRKLLTESSDRAGRGGNFDDSRKSLTNSCNWVGGGSKLSIDVQQGFRKKVAFTLAEVLITIAIVGVVAVMTLPLLTKKIEESILKSQARKAYANLQQAMKLLYSEDSTSFDCYYGIGNDCYAFYKRLVSKMKLAKTCKSKAYENGCIPNYKYKEPYSGCNYYKSDNVKNNSTAYVLLDGTIIIPYGTSTWANPTFLIDVNGQKKPNEVGFDIFTVSLHASVSGDIPNIGSGGCFNHVAPKNGKTLGEIIK